MDNSKAKDMAIICQNLEGKINITSISFSQMLPCPVGQSINHLLFVKKMFGVYFYTSLSSLDQVMHLQESTLPVYVVLEKNVFEIR